MVDIGGQPLVTHVMRCYGRFGFRRFILCTGYRHEVISNYFLNYAAVADDFTVNLGSRQIAFHQSARAPDWDVTVANTGPATMTGARVARAAARYMTDEPHFAVTYGDGLTDVDIGAEFEFHTAHRRLGTVLTINPISQFGEFRMGADGRPSFTEKPRLESSWINGGFFFFRRSFLDYLSTDADCVLEQQPLHRLVEDDELALYHHQGFWSCLDTIGDRNRMQALWETGAMPWLGKVADGGGDAGD